MMRPSPAHTRTRTLQERLGIQQEMPPLVFGGVFHAHHLNIASPSNHGAWPSELMYPRCEQHLCKQSRLNRLDDRSTRNLDASGHFLWMLSSNGHNKALYVGGLGIRRLQGRLPSVPATKPSFAETAFACAHVCGLFYRVMKKDMVYNINKMKDEAIVEQATSMLTTLLHCKRQASELKACQRTGNQCPRQHQAYLTCANEHLPAVIGSLVKIADRHCPREVVSYRMASHNPAPHRNEFVAPHLLASHYHIAPHRIVKTTSHCIAPHRTSPLLTASHLIASHCIAPHRTSPHRIASHRVASRRIASHRIASHRSSPHCIGSHHTCTASRTAQHHRHPRRP